MHVQTIEMPASVARQHFLDYRRAVRARHTDEDEALMRGYRALSQGKKIIDLAEVIPGAGLDEQLRPRLAVARADATWCWYRNMGRPMFSSRAARYSWQVSDFGLHRGRPHRELIRLASGSLPRVENDHKAMVPQIPAPMRPKAHPRNYHILWEADWTAEPPVDPILLKHLGGMLYVVLAQWDTTPLERAVLRGRL